MYIIYYVYLSMTRHTNIILIIIMISQKTKILICSRREEERLRSTNITINNESLQQVGTRISRKFNNGRWYE